MQMDSYAQQSVLGSMLIDPGCVGDVLSALTEDDFDEGPLRDTFCGIKAQFSAGKPVDPIVLVEDMGRGADKNFRSFLAQLMEITPTSANAMEYVRIVRRQGRLARLQALGLQLTTAQDAESAASLVEQINGASVSQKAGRGFDMASLLASFYDRQVQEVRNIPTGFTVLDGGLHIEAGDFIILAGYPSDGKTALALQTAYQMAEKLRIGFFSCETSSAKLFDRLAALITETPLSVIKRRELREEDYARMIAFNETIQSHKLEIIEAAGWSASDVGSYSRSRRFNVIFIDYLQLLAAPGKSRFEAVTNVSIALHTFAQRSKTVVIALSQLSREAKGNDRTERPPRLSDLRESGQIEQDADAVLLLYREDADKLNSRRVLRVAKNKEGSLASFAADFDGKIQRFCLWEDGQ